MPNPPALGAPPMNPRTCLAALAALLAPLPPSLPAQVPQLINYQGRVAVGGVNFEGGGSFKFALVNADGTQTYWSNDGTSKAGSEPAAAVTLPVAKGLYAVLLGDDALANMTPIPATVFANADVRLRVWFDDGAAGSQLLAPDQRIAAVGYAMMAGNVPDGAITGAKLAPGAAASNLGADGQSGVGSGGVILSADPNSAALLAAGYVKLGETVTADFWKQRATIGAPTARREHTAVWTGSEMLVWGGRDASGNPVNSGGRYAPATDSWTVINLAGAPLPRYRHSAVWTGTTMIVWGGLGSSSLNSGGTYDPAGDAWSPTQTSGAPVARYLHVAVWTGARMVVFGGVGGGVTGGRYDPAGDAWSPTSVGGAPTVGTDPKGVWTGTQMFVWGGQAPNGSFPTSGGLYDPIADTWALTTTTGAPVGRRLHTIVWTGAEAIVWGGQLAGGAGSPPPTNTGGRYTPGGGWTATPTTDAPAARAEHTAVWTGTEMIVWGGVGNTTGGRYNPALASAWAPTTTASAPLDRSQHTAVWTGREMILFGGLGFSIPGLLPNVPFAYGPPRTLYLYQKP